MTLDCDPRFDYGASAGAGSTAGRATTRPSARAEDCDVELQAHDRHEHGLRGPARHGTDADAGGRQGVRGAVLVRAPGADRRYEEAYDRLVWTAHHWQHWLDHGDFPDHPWRTHLQRAALTLKGLSYAPTGALVAAATTSLPETPGGERNWDYRYTWIRDSTFMLWGLYTLGFDWEANDFFYFIADVAEQGGGRPPDHVRDRRRGRAPGGHARPPLGLRGRAARARRQRRLQPGAARRLGRAARLGLPPHEVARPPGRAHLADREAPGRDGPGEVARAGPRHLGDPRRAEALHVVEDDVLGGARTAARGSPRSAASSSTRRAGSPPPTRSRTTSSSTASTSAACSSSTTTRTRSTPRCS